MSWVGCVVTRYRGERETGHDNPGDRTTLECQSQAGGKPLARGLGDSYVGQDRHPHTDIAGQIGSGSPDYKAHSRLPAQRRPNGKGDEQACDTYGLELSIEISDSPFPDSAGYLLHSAVSGRAAPHDYGKPHGIQHAGATDQCAQQRNIIVDRRHYV